MNKEIIKKWHATLEEGCDALLDFAEGLNINEFVIENGERVVWFEDGNTYRAHAYRMGERDGEEEKEIIETLEECGVEFRK